MKFRKLNNVEKRVCDHANELADELGYDIWDVRFEKEGAERYLRVFIENLNGAAVNIEDCEKMTRPLDKWLDDEDFISESYIFEVGSAGLGRELSAEKHFDFALVKGLSVDVKLFTAVNGEKIIIGKLESYSSDSLNVGGVEIPLTNVAKVNVQFQD